MSLCLYTCIKYIFVHKELNASLVCVFLYVCSWSVHIVDGILLIVAHALDTPTHTTLLTRLFDYGMYLQHLDIRDEK